MKKLIFLFMFFWTTTIFAEPFNRIIFFGDSLTDNGNLYKKFLKIIPKSPPYYKGRFSNGMTWAEGLGDRYYKKYYSSYKVYAVGGATAIYHHPNGKFIAPSTLTAQVNDYLLDSNFQDKSKVLFAVWIGANDYMFDEKADGEVVSTKVTEQIATSIKTLISKGGKSFVVLNLPDLAKSPFAQNNNKSSERLSELSQLHNKKLLKVMEELKNANPQIKIIYINLFDMLNDVIANPAKYNKKYNGNITDTTTACWKGGYFFQDQNQKDELKQALRQGWIAEYHSAPSEQEIDQLVEQARQTPEVMHAYHLGKSYQLGLAIPCAKPNEHIFWDQLHPTEIVHRVLGEIIEEIIDFAMPA
ncbi:MAG: SGNH/GDSL hydrolase family protein [Gammaproteobacteria bacterium]|nr:SGNH/GDSL hydrolase family protein [Gammaproteobacteria bacterium]